MVGSSGRSVERSAVLTARPRSVPAWICVLALVETPKNICVVPPTVAMVPEFTSRYGTWTISTPADVLRNAQARCGTVPMPAEAQVSVPGFGVARAKRARDRSAGTGELVTRG